MNIVELNKKEVSAVSGGVYFIKAAAQFTSSLSDTLKLFSYKEASATLEKIGIILYGVDKTITIGCDICQAILDWWSPKKEQE